MEPTAAEYNSHKEVVRPEANFPPCVWGDKFITYVFDTQMAEELSKEIEELKDEVKSMLTAPGTKMVDTINLIDTIERLGISYHFENEIEDKLELLFSLNNKKHEDDSESHDLYSTALQFRLLRQHGRHISCDIFSKFMDGNNGNFLESLKNDTKGLLSLYEAAHLRVNGEDILEDALTFATTNLKSMDPNHDWRLKKQVVRALSQPLHWGCPRIEARNFINIYKEDESKNEILLKLAKLDYNLLQMLHKEELREVSRWWKELDLISKLPYARDRVVECYFWAVGTFNEPQFSRARIMLAKTIAMTSAIDDTYDAYGTIEEIDIFTKAIQRWDISEVDHLPEYMIPLYKALLELYVQFEEELKERRSYFASHAIAALKKLVRGYEVEAKWFIEGYLPPFSEYLDVSLVTSTYHYLTISSLLGVMSATNEDFEWVNKKPKFLVALEQVCRLIDDVATYEVEKERGQTATGIECYMKEYGVTKKHAENEFLEMAKIAWKHINEGCLEQSAHPSCIVKRVAVNLARVIEVVYKNNLQDGYTLPETVLKPHILALFVDPIIT
uniref:Putative cyperene synthase n=1 Tax=Scoparia dulcis TaxID=107240 RepID=A0A5K7Y7M0_SCODU|nr:putative cyperene synthase [Scoparia dulcis]